VRDGMRAARAKFFHPMEAEEGSYRDRPAPRRHRSTRGSAACCSLAPRNIAWRKLSLPLRRPYRPARSARGQANPGRPEARGIP
jgi:hypothetical protein